MKTIAAFLIAAAALFTVSSCSTEVHTPVSRTTTTEETTVHRPGSTITNTSNTMTTETKIRRH